ncbi:RNA polymerase sigma factor [Leifsonia sp. LS-T14]|uniref:RNA polymerase sigma factor n=1 Tax=unclassified Leifsonia TaxID=2663824 RepID=UPI0035A6A34C
MRTSSAPDAVLSSRARAGDMTAFGELWTRHSGAGRRFALSLTNQFDADDLVSEAFTRILAQLKEGKGPQDGFCRYLFRSIHRIAIDWSRREKHVNDEEAPEGADPHCAEAVTLAAEERTLSGRAFQSLPTRWQEVLWYSEVESMKPSEFAPLLNMSVNAAAQLACRARAGLREAFAELHAPAPQLVAA